MRKFLLPLAVCICVAACLALTSCFGGGNCDHPSDKLTYGVVGSNQHSVFCEACHTQVAVEACATPDGKCGTCSLCGSTGSHEYVSTGESNDETHSKKCTRCNDVVTVAHSFSDFGYGSNTNHIEHDVSRQCYECGYSAKIYGAHSSKTNEWLTSATNHWKVCDVCGAEFEYKLHNLENGACTGCGYEAEELPVTEGLTFELSFDGTYYKVTGMSSEYLEYDGFYDIVIPATYEDLPVKTIASMAFNNYYSNGYNIRSVYIPDGVTTVENDAFYYGVRIADIRIPSTLEYIANGAFRQCGIISLTLPKGLTDVGSYAFNDCQYLTSVVLEDGIQHIREYAFANCENLKSITLPASVVSIDETAFLNCDRIKTITLDSQNNKYVVIDNCLISKEDMKLIRADSSMVIPSQVKIIGRNALSCNNNYYLGRPEKLVKTDVIIPVTIEKIEGGALSYSTINTVNFSSDTEQNDFYSAEGNYVFEKETFVLIWGNSSCVIPSFIKELGERAFSFCELGDFVIPANIKKMAFTSFNNCFFDNLTIEDGVEQVMFSECHSNQQTLTIPGSVKSISNSVDYDDRFCLFGIEKLVLSEGVESINVYFDCEVVLPSTIKYVGEHIAREYKNITEYEGYKYFGDATNPYYVLVRPVVNGDVTALKIHKDTKVIASKALMNEKLTSITFEGNNVITIGDAAFRNVFETYADTLILPDSIKHIGSYAFYSDYCSESTRLILGKGVETAGDYVVCTRNGSYRDQLTWMGAVGYLGTSDNPFFMVVAFDPYKLENYNGWDDPGYIIKAETKIIAAEVGYWYNPTYKGTEAEFGKLFITDAFKNDLNEMEERIVICNDGIVTRIS